VEIRRDVDVADARNQICTMRAKVGQVEPLSLLLWCSLVDAEVKGAVMTLASMRDSSFFFFFYFRVGVCGCARAVKGPFIANYLHTFPTPTAQLTPSFTYCGMVAEIRTLGRYNSTLYPSITFSHHLSARWGGEQITGFPLSFRWLAVRLIKYGRYGQVQVQVIDTDAGGCGCGVCSRWRLTFFCSEFFLEQDKIRTYRGEYNIFFEGRDGCFFFGLGVGTRYVFILIHTQRAWGMSGL